MQKFTSEYSTRPTPEWVECVDCEGVHYHNSYAVDNGKFDNDIDGDFTCFSCYQSVNQSPIGPNGNIVKWTVLRIGIVKHFIKMFFKDIKVTYCCFFSNSDFWILGISSRVSSGSDSFYSF